jgi:hypothetical protein
MGQNSSNYSLSKQILKTVILKNSGQICAFKLINEEDFDSKVKQQKHLLDTIRRQQIYLKEFLFRSDE